jgi:hypothetical protein
VLSLEVGIEVPDEMLDYEPDRDVIVIDAGEKGLKDAFYDALPKPTPHPDAQAAIDQAEKDIAERGDRR